MEFKETGSNDSGKLGERTNLEGGEKEKESGYTLEKLAEKILEESGPYIPELIKRTRNEVREKILKDDFLTEDERKKLLSDEKKLDERTSSILRDKTNFPKGTKEISLKEIAENYLIAEAIGILDMKTRNYLYMVNGFYRVLIFDKMQKNLDDLRFEEKELISREVIETKQMKDKRKYNRMGILREKIENAIGKSFNQLSNNEIKRLDIHKVYDDEEFQQIKEEYDEMQKLWNRFGGGNLSEAEEEHKRKKRVVGKWKKIDEEKKKKE